MSKVPFTVKISGKVIGDFKRFCDSHGIKYSFFVEDAIRKKLEEEELKEDILDLKTLREEEKNAIPFEEYLRERSV